MSLRTATVTLGDAVFVIAYEIHGKHLFATQVDPEEWPEIELKRLATASGTDVSGLLEFEPAYERISEQIDELERETNYGRDPDPDEAYDRARDARLEAAR